MQMTEWKVIATVCPSLSLLLIHSIRTIPARLETRFSAFRAFRGREREESEFARRVVR